MQNFDTDVNETVCLEENNLTRESISYFISHSDVSTHSSEIHLLCYHDEKENE
jgi:hypothetical protein